MLFLLDVFPYACPIPSSCTLILLFTFSYPAVKVQNQNTWYGERSMSTSSIWDRFKVFLNKKGIAYPKQGIGHTGSKPLWSGWQDSIDNWRTLLGSALLFGQCGSIWEICNAHVLLPFLCPHSMPSFSLILYLILLFILSYQMVEGKESEHMIWGRKYEPPCHMRQVQGISQQMGYSLSKAGYTIE